MNCLNFTAVSHNNQKVLFFQTVNFIWAFHISLLILLVFIVLSPDKLLHWFVLPVFLCGAIICADALKWFKGQVDLFDPVGIIGVYGFHFFFLAPLLHTYYDYWMPFTGIIHPPDWRDWVGFMAILNLLGLLGYKVITRGYVHLNTSKRTLWIIDERIFLRFLLLALFITLGLQIAVYAKFGGLAGYIAIFEEGIGSFLTFRGMGIWFTISESFASLFFIGIIVFGKRKGFIRKPRLTMIILCIFFSLKLLFGGLRGSRSETVYAMVWAVGTVHFVLRPVARKFIYMGMISLFIFMYFYGFYKGVGSQIKGIFIGEESLSTLEQYTGRDARALLLGDLGRTDVQAFLLYRIIEIKDYEYAWGRTYLGAVALLIPRQIWPDRPPTKIKEGTEAQYGMGSYIPDQFQSSKVYGLAGETMLNFGPLGVPFAFLLWGFVVRCVRSYVYSLNADDARRLIATWLVILCWSLLMGDSDNNLFFIAKNVTIPFLLLWIGTRKVKDRSYAVE
jgi:hypothetical protein